MNGIWIIGRMYTMQKQIGATSATKIDFTFISNLTVANVSSKKFMAKAQTFRFTSHSHMITHLGLIEIQNPEQLGSVTNS